MVVYVLVVQPHFVIDHVEVASEEGVHHLTHRNHHTAQLHKTLPQLERAALNALLIDGGREELVREILDFLVQRLHRLEIAVDDHVEKTVQEKRDTVHGQIRGGIPTVHHDVDVEVLVSANSDQHPFGDERGDLGRCHLCSRPIKGRLIRGKEEMVGVPVELGPLTEVDRIFDGQSMQRKLIRKDPQILEARADQIHPHHSSWLLQMLGNISKRKVLIDQLAAAVATSPCHLFSTPAHSGETVPGRVCPMLHATHRRSCADRRLGNPPVLGSDRNSTHPCPGSARSTPSWLRTPSRPGARTLAAGTPRQARTFTPAKGPKPQRFCPAGSRVRGVVRPPVRVSCEKSERGDDQPLPHQ